MGLPALIFLLSLLGSCGGSTPAMPTTPGNPVAAVEIVAPTSRLTSLGQRLQLDTVVRDSAGRELLGVPVEWSSSNPAVIWVGTTGAVTARLNGEATITARVGSSQVLGTLAMSVAQVAAAFELVLLGPDTLWSVGARTRLRIEAQDSLGRSITDENLEGSWSSSAPEVLRAEPGLVEAVGEGAALLRVQVDDFVREWPFAVVEDVATSIAPDLGESFQRIISDTLAGRGVVGMTAALYLPGRGTWIGSAGWNVPDVKRMRPSTVFPVGSVSKTFGAAVVLSLTQSGVMSLNDSIGDWLDPIEHITPGINIRWVMRQASGLAPWSGHPNINTIFSGDPNRHWLPDELLRTFGMPPTFQPGAQYQSSVTNLFVVGLMARRAAGTSYSRAIRTRLLDPVGLENTYLAAEEEPRGHLGRVWTSNAGSFVDLTPHEGILVYSLRWASSGMNSNAEDLVRWSTALFGGELFSDDLMQEMLDFIPDSGTFRIGNIGGQNGSGLGVRRYDFNGREYWGHSGVTGGTGTELLYDSATGISVVVIVNQSPASHDAVHIRTALALMEAALAM